MIRDASGVMARLVTPDERRHLHRRALLSGCRAISLDISRNCSVDVMTNSEKARWVTFCMPVG